MNNYIPKLICDPFLCIIMKGNEFLSGLITEPSLLAFYNFFLFLLIPGSLFFCCFKIYTGLMGNPGGIAE